MNNRNYVHFNPFTLPEWDNREIEPGTGWYYTRYNPETQEGEGWFGTENEPAYDFEDSLFENADGDAIMMTRTCGYGAGCVWSDWH